MSFGFIELKLLPAAPNKQAGLMRPADSQLLCDFFIHNRWALSHLLTSDLNCTDSGKAILELLLPEIALSRLGAIQPRSQYTSYLDFALKEQPNVLSDIPYGFVKILDDDSGTSQKSSSPGREFALVLCTLNSRPLYWRKLSQDSNKEV